MSGLMIWLSLVTAFLLLSPVVIWRSRRDYRACGRLSWLSFALLMVWFFVPHLALDFAVRYETPWGLRQYTGLLAMLLGVAVLPFAFRSFGSVRKVFAQSPGDLTVAGPYRWSRNPQYVAWFLLFLGFAILGWTWRCWIALGLLGAALYVLVWVEEEHLARTFGDAYRAYRARTPRWLGWPRPEAR